VAWAAFVDFFHDYLEQKGLHHLQAIRDKWKLTSRDHLSDQTGYALIQAGKDAGFYGKSVTKGLHGLLHRRNECAHPGAHAPDFNESLGYMSELLQRLKYLRDKP
jgi:hypothetical protein